MPRKQKNKSLDTSEANSDLETKKEETGNTDISDEDLDTTDESEDDSAILLTDKVENNIFQTLLKIKNKDPDIYDQDHKFFNDSDFEIDEDDQKKEPEKPLTYSDLLRETLLKEGAEAFDEKDQIPEKGFSYIEEQSRLKNEFLEATKALDDDDFLTKTDAVDDIPEIKNFLPQNKAVRENELISKYWSSEEKLDENEEFLRDYILNQRWREDRLENFKVDHSLEKFDEYDEEHFDKAEEVEYKYNHRFEEKDGSKIIGYPRNIEDSARKKDERRRLKRLEKKQRKKDEKIRRDEEIKRLKNLRKTVNQKMKEIATTAGVIVKNDAIDLEAPFDPEQHERDMKKIIGLGYDKEEVDEVESDDDPEIWWKCDDCDIGIPSGARHFDCKECENFTLCEECISKSSHEHKEFTSKKVPIVCAPPEELEENFDLDYEDYIGDMPVKFKYRKVEPVPVDIKTVLEKSDKELNQMMPLRTLLSYDVPGIGKPDSNLKLKKKRKFQKDKDFNNPNKKKKYLKAMTKYNVNRDRLSAYGLDKKRSDKK